MRPQIDLLNNFNSNDAVEVIEEVSYRVNRSLNEDEEALFELRDRWSREAPPVDLRRALLAIPRLFKEVEAEGDRLENEILSLEKAVEEAIFALGDLPYEVALNQAAQDKIEAIINGLRSAL